MSSGEHCSARLNKRCSIDKRTLENIYQDKYDRPFLLRNGLNYNNHHIKLFNSDPFLRTSAPSEKMWFMENSDELILNYVKEQLPHINVRSDVITVKIRDWNNVLTEYLNVTVMFM